MGGVFHRFSLSSRVFQLSRLFRRVSVYIRDVPQVSPRIRCLRSRSSTALVENKKGSSKLRRPPAAKTGVTSTLIAVTACVSPRGEKELGYKVADPLWSPTDISFFLRDPCWRVTGGGSPL
ncbi:hypothetical protein HPB50_002874 [Hyalomma asiaticum]|uniref:Uncharacterized protein n=1 Tax=Hyalomma asiaticum TaxID=266040 RepID=A0ACB7SDF0_HYAAI|nr:hypothetical protein HPB50_002874 [Hyalomma asiaticum]